MITMVSGCKKDEDNIPCPAAPVPEYAAMKYYLTNPSGRGEQDTISYSPVVGTDDYLITCLPSSFPGNAYCEFSGPEIEIYYAINADSTMFFEGSGVLGDKEMFIYWKSANIDTTSVTSFYSVYSKVRLN